MPYYYKDGQLPTHTKPGFTSLNVLTVHNVILKNMLIYVNNFFNFPGSLSVHVKFSISNNIPVPNTPPDDYFDWYTIYNSIPYNTSAPLLYYHIMTKNTYLHRAYIKTQQA